MDGYRIDTYGRSFADVYDGWYPHDPDCVASLERLAAGGPVLDLGAGTAAIADALAQRGVPVVALDASTEMLDLARARRQQGDVRVDLVQADMSRLPLAPRGTFSLVFVSYNTLFNLIDPNDQDRCLREATGRVRPGGALAMEAFVPAPDARRSDVGVSRVTTDAVVLTVSVHDPDMQRVDGQHIEIYERGHRLRPWSIRYSPPAELDERLAHLGFGLEARHSDWRGNPFDNGASRHVSIWRSRSNQSR